MLGPTNHLFCVPPHAAGLKNNGNPEVARQLILMGAKIDEQDIYGKTALHNSIICKHAPLCQLLLENGASLTIETKVTFAGFVPSYHL
ncbi:hypothetical protein AAHC03_05635 [Spirometra sp. Aus1]